MRTIEQLSEEDPGEPPSLESSATHHNALLEAHDRLEIYPPYPSYVSETREFECLLFDDYSSIEIKASLSGRLVEKYKTLSVDQKFTLQEKVALSMGHVAVGVMGDVTPQAIADVTAVLMNDVPVIFEPINHAMLVGSWVDENTKLTDDESKEKLIDDEAKEKERRAKLEKKKLHIKSQFIESYDQQRTLLAGLALLVTYLEQR